MNKLLAILAIVAFGVSASNEHVTLGARISGFEPISNDTCITEYDPNTEMQHVTLGARISGEFTPTCLESTQDSDGHITLGARIQAK